MKNSTIPTSTVTSMNCTQIDLSLLILSPFLPQDARGQDRYINQAMNDAMVRQQKSIDCRCIPVFRKKIHC
jgi:hypothetical protein